MSIDMMLLTALFFVAALIYSSVGFGGGSAYLALLTLFGLPLQEVAVLALVCNIVVVAGGSWHFAKAGHLRLDLALPFLLASLPAAFLGGRYFIDTEVLRIVMGWALVIASLALAFERRASIRDGAEIPRSRLWPGGILLGGSIGGLSGVVGIGGGVFLAPVLHLLYWGTAKQIAATASVFILLNSIAGLAGKLTWMTSATEISIYFALLLAVAVGGQIGSRAGAQYLLPVTVKRLTALVILVAAMNLLLSG
jgi:uncharacterized protein